LLDLNIISTDTLDCDTETTIKYFSSIVESFEPTGYLKPSIKRIENKYRIILDRDALADWVEASVDQFSDDEK
jgi:hypothetical protein